MSSNAIQEKADAYELEEANLVDADLPARHKALVRKLDWRLSPLFWLVYLITFIDRASVGNARVAGLEADLGLRGYQFNISLTVFYITYALFEMTSNHVVRYISPNRWLALQVAAFGIISLATAFVRNFAGLIVLRIVLGISEAGVLPVMGLILSRFYTRAELVLRIGIMVSAASLAGGFGGLLASGFISIGPLKGVGSVITILIAVVVYLLAPSSPETARFLTQDERELASSRLNSSKKLKEVSPELKKRLTKQAFRALPTWLAAFGYLTTNVSVQGVSLFLPTILRGLYPGRTTVQIQLLSVGPYCVAFVWTLFLCFLSARLDRRGVVLLISSPFAIAGYITFVATSLADTKARLAAAFLCILGAFPIGPFMMSWGMNNAATDTERSVAGGLVPGFGQFGAIVATWSYLSTDAPNYKTGNSINIGFSCATWGFTFLLFVYLTWENRQRRAGKRDHRLATVPASEDPTDYLGSQHPGFIYST